jgi:hypothetical protein
MQGLIRLLPTRRSAFILFGRNVDIKYHLPYVMLEKILDCFTLEASCDFLPEGNIANSRAAQGNCSLESYII